MSSDLVMEQTFADMAAEDRAEAFLRGCGMEPTKDAIGQLLEVFLPCLQIIIDHGWGELWRQAGILHLATDVYKKAERFDHRLWHEGILHHDSGYDLINFVGFCLRSDPDSRFGPRGEPSPPRKTS